MRELWSTDCCVRIFDASPGSMTILGMELHPIMYVPDQYAEREFYELFGFERHYEGDEFPGFLAIRHGDAIIGLQRASAEHPAYTEGLRWQFELERVDELDEMLAACRPTTSSTRSSSSRVATAFTAGC